MESQQYDFIISRNNQSNDCRVWKLNPASKKLLEPIELDPSTSLPADHQLLSIGNYLLEWGPLNMDKYFPCYPYRLFKFDPTSTTPFAETVTHGVWPKHKFFGSRSDFGNPKGATKKFAQGAELQLKSLGNYVLNWIPTEGRGTYQLFNFDPAHPDPLPEPVSPQGAWLDIEQGHELIPVGQFIIDWNSATQQYRVWSVDPQGKNPVTQPIIQQGTWKSIGVEHQLVVIGNYIMAWHPNEREYRLWEFDYQSSDPLGEPVQRGQLPAEFNIGTTLTGVQPLIPIVEANENKKGTIDFMRSKIKHVVYYMVENRSFDHVCGWLYEKDSPAHFVGSDEPFKGASTDLFNDDGDQKAFLSKYEKGKLSEDYLLELLSEDPYHDNSDVLRQMFYKNETGYANRETPNMGGFVWNNGTPQVMETYSPKQLPVLNGLAKNFAVSDEWFCSMPGGTDVNRAFALTGSALGQLNNFQNGTEYQYWADATHRPSIWKILWNNGITDWKIYNSIEWMDFIFTYHLFLEGQIPTVDKNVKDYVNPISHFFEDARNGTLPAFSYLEPIWVANTGSTSYHPGGDLIPGEMQLHKVFEALQNSPQWEETLLVITFDEHGGIYDHVPPPYAANPYPNDKNDGFSYDIMGVRIPTILVSPWLNEKTVFRSGGPVAYDSTSILASILDWQGIPKARWGLGERTRQAPTIEETLLRDSVRDKKVKLKLPYDRDYPKKGAAPTHHPVHNLHRDSILPLMVAKIAKGKLSRREMQAACDDIIESSHSQQQLVEKITEFKQRCS